MKPIKGAAKRRPFFEVLLRKFLRWTYMQGLTKRERQVTDPEQILRILDESKVLQLGLSVNDEP